MFKLSVLCGLMAVLGLMLVVIGVAMPAITSASLEGVSVSIRTENFSMIIPAKQMPITIPGFKLNTKMSTPLGEITVPLEIEEKEVLLEIPETTLTTELQPVKINIDASPLLAFLNLLGFLVILIGLALILNGLILKKLHIQLRNP